ncbi:hypothetical protein UlMin_007853 [Ulmus minor]
MSIFKIPSALCRELGSIVASFWWVSTPTNRKIKSCPKRQIASFIWKSIVWGRELLNKGLIWKIGNGLSVKALSDPWLARPMSFKPITKNPQLDDPTVTEFLNPLGWNTQLIEENFWPIDIAEITNITVPRNREADKL